mgnify:FL=1|jgi:hypothetical protein|nr:MAG TPA_asm: Minor capsid protein [Caudoviricetes sp.]
MIYPSLVRKKYCKTDIHVILYGENTTEDGAPEIVLDKDLKCNYQDSAKRVLTTEKVIIQINGVALFYEDFAPDIPVISSGKVTIFGETREIYQGTKARNPDGTVNYIKLEIQ